MNRRGLTLLELLCASTLATLLMVALMGVLAGLAKTEKALDRHEPPAAWRRRLAARLTSDLRAAEEATPTANGFRLTGPLARDRGTGTHDWTAATVEYRIEDSPLGLVFLRSEARRVGPQRIETLAFGATRLVVTSSRGDPPIQQTNKPFTNDLLDGRSVPRTMRLLLIDADGAIFCDERLSP